MVKQTLTQGECLAFHPQPAIANRQKKEKKRDYFGNSNHADLISMALEHRTQALVMASGRRLAVWLQGPRSSPAKSD